jgi:ADP-ribosyl-[dinitrogen reductase] hydrolase
VLQPNADLSPTKRSRVIGCIVGGAVGDALSAPVEFMGMAQIASTFGPGGIADYEIAYGRRGAITDDTQLTLFTAEGLIGSKARPQSDFENAPSAIHRAYLRWLHTQGEPQDKDLVVGWLVEQRVLYNSRSPGITTLSALRSGEMGTVEKPLNDSKGCGGVTRAAAVAVAGEAAFDLGMRVAAITHGHPTAQLVAGAFAAVIAALLDGAAIGAAIDGARGRLAGRKAAREVLIAIDAAANLAESDPDAAIDRLGTGWVAEEALAIALFSALTAPDFATGVLRAVNHGGESNSTGAMTGSILGAKLGREAIRPDWVAGLEARAVIEQVGEDLAVHFVDDRPDLDGGRYPG